MADDLPIFRREFKRYKQRKSRPDFSNVIDFEQQESWKGRVTKCRCTLLELDNFNFTQLGLKNLDTWKCYEIEGYKGFQIIVNPFTPSGQQLWTQKCVEIYPDKPNVCNLDARVGNRDQNLWKLYQEHCLNLDKSSPQNTKPSKTLMEQLRWVTLGYHYNWDAKKYSKENFSPFPSDLANLSKCIAEVMGYPCFTAEAAIINYYHMDSTLSGHTDHSELDLTAPLFSISFGQTCIFLLGGETLNAPPCAMFLRSGDIVMMSGDSRLAYHAVPRILPDPNIASMLTDISQCETTLEQKQNLKSLGKYLSYSRINVNIRQVEGPAGHFPNQDESVID